MLVFISLSASQYLYVATSFSLRFKPFLWDVQNLNKGAQRLLFVLQWRLATQTCPGLCFADHL